MTRRVARLTVDGSADLVGECGSCLYWQRDPVSRERVAGAEADEVTVWLSEVLRDWGSCGRVVYVDDRPAGHALYVPSVYAAGAHTHPTAPVSADAVLLSSLRVDPDFRGHGLGRPPPSVRSP